MMLLKLGLLCLACMFAGGLGQSIGERSSQAAKLLLVVTLLIAIVSVLTGWIWLPEVMAASIVVLFFAFGLARGESEHCPGGGYG